MKQFPYFYRIIYKNALYDKIYLLISNNTNKILKLNYYSHKYVIKNKGNV